MVEYFGHLLDFMSGWSLIVQTAIVMALVVGIISLAAICEHFCSKWRLGRIIKSLFSALGKALYWLGQAYEGVFSPPERHEGGRR